MEGMSRSEEQVMLVVWGEEGETPMKEIRLQVNGRFHHEWAPQTVSTFLDRLHKKGWLEMEKRKGIWFYHPAVGLDVYRKMKLAEVLAELYNGDSDTLKADLAHQKA